MGPRTACAEEALKISNSKESIRRVLKAYRCILDIGVIYDTRGASGMVLDIYFHFRQRQVFPAKYEFIVSIIAQSLISWVRRLEVVTDEEGVCAW